MGKKSKKGGSKKGKKGKGNENAPFNEWANDLNKALETKFEIKYNDNVIADCIENSDPHRIRDYLWKYPKAPDPDDEQITFDEVKVKSTLYKKVVCYYFAELRKDVVEDVNITELLLEAYDTARVNGKHMEVILVSSDKKREHFEEFFQGMPWYAIPHKDKKAEYLALQYKVKELPRLVILGQDGEVVLDDAVKKLRQNTLQFPFCKAAPDNVVLIAQRRPNRNPCTCVDCKCKQFVGSKSGDEVQADGSILKLPVTCNDCAHADIYHIPEREMPEDKAKAAKKK